LKLAFQTFSSLPKYDSKRRKRTVPNCGTLLNATQNFVSSLIPVSKALSEDTSGAIIDILGKLSGVISSIIAILAQRKIGEQRLSVAVTRHNHKPG